MSVPMIIRNTTSHHPYRSLVIPKGAHYAPPKKPLTIHMPLHALYSCLKKSWQPDTFRFRRGGRKSQMGQWLKRD